MNFFIDLQNLITRKSYIKDFNPANNKNFQIAFWKIIVKKTLKTQN